MDEGIFVTIFNKGIDSVLGIGENENITVFHQNFANFSILRDLTVRKSNLNSGIKEVEKITVILVKLYDIGVKVRVRDIQKLFEDLVENFVKTVRIHEERLLKVKNFLNITVQNRFLVKISLDKGIQGLVWKEGNEGVEKQLDNGVYQDVLEGIINVVEGN